MDKDEEKIRRSNRRVGWTIGIIVLVLYAIAIFYGAGR